MKKIILILVLVFLLMGLMEMIVVSAQLPKELDTPYIHYLWENAKKEEGFIFTYGMPRVWSNYAGIFDEFERLFGIKQRDIDMGGSKLLARMTEENATKNDLGDITRALVKELTKRGLTSRYRVRLWGDIPPSQRGEDDTGSVWQATYVGTLGFLVNTNIVKNIPKRWIDLANPEYKHLIQYQDPKSSNTGINTIFAMSYALTGDPYDYKAGVDFLAKLHEMEVISSVVTETIVSDFQRGECAIVINWDFNSINWKETLDVPSVFIIPEDGTISGCYSVIMSKNPPHPFTASLAMEFIYSKYGQSLYTKGFVTPIIPGVEVPTEVKDKIPSKEAYQKAKLIDYDKQTPIIPELQKYYSEKL